MSIIKLENIGKIYNPSKVNSCEALRGVDLEIERGDLIAVIGESGSGKSTLLHILGCLDSPTSGEMSFGGKRVSFKSTKRLAAYRNEKIGFVLQDFGLILNETALENVCVTLLFSKTPFVKMKSRAKNALDALNIGNLANKRVSQPSGGQKQRVAIARALVNDPEIILADEPTGALDSKTSSEIVNTLLELNDSGKTVIIVTHDPKIAARCGRVVTIADGELCE